MVRVHPEAQLQGKGISLGRSNNKTTTPWGVVAVVKITEESHYFSGGSMPINLFYNIYLRRLAAIIFLIKLITGFIQVL